jgi:hypothetical protein
MPVLEMYSVATPHDSVAIAERRKHPRIKAGIPVEFKPEGADCFTHAQTSDISCGGCYVEMNFTLPVGTRLDFALWLNDAKITTKAVVTTHHPYFGNGIQFLGLSAQDRNRLNGFLQAGLH